MTIYVANDGSKIVDTIGERNSIVRKFDGMKVTVRNAIADIMVGGAHEAGYRWDSATSDWILTYKDSVDSIDFISDEEQIIVDGKVMAAYAPQNAAVWNCQIIDENGLIQAEVKPNVSMREITIGSMDYDGMGLRFSYAYGIAKSASSLGYEQLQGRPTFRTVNGQSLTGPGGDIVINAGTDLTGGTGKILATYIPDAILGQLKYLGVYDMATALPSASANAGGYYIANNATMQNGYVMGDWAVSNGTTWDKIDNTDAVQSVQGRTGAVVITKADLSLGNVEDVALSTWTGSSNLATVSNTASDARGKLRSIPLSAQTGVITNADNGQFRKLTAGVTLNSTSNMVAGDSVVLMNDTTGSLVVTLTSVTAYIGGTNTTKTSVSLATRGVCSILCTGTNAFVLTGNIS